MRINHNISALKTNNILGKNNKALEKSLERLSSGYRINCAADDAAGLAISQKMKTQIAGLNQAARNASDGISVIQTAEGALIEVEEMLQRMRELSVQAANGSNTDDDRKALQDEVEQLKAEINRISDTTEFNTKKLLNGTVDRRSYSDNANVELISLSDSVNVKSYTFEVEKEGTQAIVKSQLTGNSAPVDGTITVNNQTINITAGSDLNKILQDLDAVCGNMGIYVGYTDGTVDETAVGGFKTVAPGDLTMTDAYLLFVTDDYGTNAELNINCSDPQLAAMLGISAKGTQAAGSDAGIRLHTNEAAAAGVTGNNVPTDTAQAGTMTITETNRLTGETTEISVTISASVVEVSYMRPDGTTITRQQSVPALPTNAEAIGYVNTLFQDCGIPNMEVVADAANGNIAFQSRTPGEDHTLDVTGSVLGVPAGSYEGINAGGFSNTATVTVDGDYVTVRDRSDFEMVFQLSSGSIGEVTVTVLDAGPMTLQIGANEGQTMEVRIPKVDVVTLGIETANVGTQEGASAAITLFENAVREVSAIRAKLGAYQNRLDHAINSLNVSGENLTEALSRIEDTDMAGEMATFTQLQVLTQAATSMLAQANERPQNILNLLQS